ncbi:hypothetical protein C6H68_24110 [Photorhabdus luminescens]|nr:hypothetical protein C6H68_24110 [Photorhabdus luminescens]
MMTHCFLFLKIWKGTQYAIPSQHMPVWLPYFILPGRNNSASLVSGAYSAMLTKKMSEQKPLPHHAGLLIRGSQQTAGAAV